MAGKTGWRRSATTVESGDEEQGLAVDTGKREHQALGRRTKHKMAQSLTKEVDDPEANLHQLWALCFSVT